MSSAVQNKPNCLCLQEQSHDEWVKRFFLKTLSRLTQITLLCLPKKLTSLDTVKHKLYTVYGLSNVNLAKRIKLTGHFWSYVLFNKKDI